MVVEGVASASTTTTNALLLCPRVGWNHGSTFLVVKTITLSHSFAFILRLTCPVNFLISAIAVTLRLLSSTGTLPLGVSMSSTVSLGGCQVGASGASSLSLSLCLVPEYVPAAKRTWLRASVELVQLGAPDAASEVPLGQQ
ncbi:hypothetical protein PC129_g15845 [Phytophthora cactorum]|uniref:Uncharacterized protein n=1 Tax=Phytophthora cactorum TaxID=29920 RepID=A0A8T1B9H5_9STRA|nr:hypothetical protein Pcac1_g25692 [Phytophthora cactorum]KAG2806776.1 hypothetical protein PC112_g17699 [Phytophthora cactorum]KAG2808397.1 hypothetical protein PC111_g16504 [Phytophthora cactorum]KAG2848029.1 hypothetical protein PC113_g17659 [Phytophthora cactorum]KAG2886312.1 hypothetical protein PC114_g19309 [Phytophthora cactorum]